MFSPVKRRKSLQSQTLENSRRIKDYVVNLGNIDVSCLTIIVVYVIKVFVFGQPLPEDLDLPVLGCIFGLVS